MPLDNNTQFKRLNDVTTRTNLPFLEQWQDQEQRFPTTRATNNLLEKDSLDTQNAGSMYTTTQSQIPEKLYETI